MVGNTVVFSQNVKNKQTNKQAKTNKLFVQYLCWPAKILLLFLSFSAHLRQGAQLSCITMLVILIQHTKHTLEYQVSAAYLPSLCTNWVSGSIPDPYSVHLVFTPNLLPQAFLLALRFSFCIYKTGPKRSKLWSEGPPGKQWYTLSEDTLSGLFHN